MARAAYDLSGGGSVKKSVIFRGIVATGVLLAALILAGCGGGKAEPAKSDGGQRMNDQNMSGMDHNKMNDQNMPGMDHSKMK